MNTSLSASILKPCFGQGEITRRRGLATSDVCAGQRGGDDKTRNPLARLGRLAAGQTLKFPVRTAGRLHVVAGLAWATLSEDPKDYWLRGTAELALRPGQVLVMSAEGPQDLRWAFVPEPV